MTRKEKFKYVVSVVMVVLCLIAIPTVLICSLLTNDTLFDNVAPYKELLFNALSSDATGYVMVVLIGLLSCILVDKFIRW